MTALFESSFQKRPAHALALPSISMRILSFSCCRFGVQLLVMLSRRIPTFVASSFAVMYARRASSSELNSLDILHSLVRSSPSSCSSQKRTVDSTQARKTNNKKNNNNHVRCSMLRTQRLGGEQRLGAQAAAGRQAPDLKSKPYCLHQRLICQQLFFLTSLTKLRWFTCTPESSGRSLQRHIPLRSQSSRHTRARPSPNR